MSDFHALIISNTKIRAHGGHTIASMIRNHNWDCEVLDFAANIHLEYLKEFCRQRITSKTKFIAISMLVFEFRDDIIILLDWIKQHWPEIILISGSQNLTQTNKIDQIDYYFVGYSEFQFIKFLKWKFSNGEPIDVVDKVIDCHNHNGAAPMQDPSIIYEDRDYIQPWEFLNIEFSRGCKFACAFCDFPFVGVKGDYSRSASSADKQIQDAFNRFGVTRYIVSDETYNDSPAKLIKFANMIDELPFEPIFGVALRADLLISRPNDREQLMKSRMFGHFYGIETLNYDTGKIIKKGMNPEKVKEGLLDIKKYFSNSPYRATISLIAGLPEESLDSLNKTKNWMVNNWMDQHVAFNPYQIQDINVEYRGSAIESNLEKYGYKILNKNKKQEHLNLMMKGNRRNNWMQQFCYWQNKNMNYGQAVKFVQNFYRVAHAKKMKEGFNGLSTMNINRTIEELLQTTIRKEYYELHPEYFVNLQNYIEKKLGNSF